MNKANFKTAYEAALAGLPQAVRVDQVLVHALGPGYFAGSVFRGYPDGHVLTAHWLDNIPNAPVQDGLVDNAPLETMGRDDVAAQRNQVPTVVFCKSEHRSCSLLLCGTALGLFSLGNWRVELAYRLDAGIPGKAFPDVPERVEWNLGSCGECLNLRMAQGPKVRPDLFGRG